MPLKLIDSVNSILELVKEQTGKDIEFIEKSDLPVQASIEIAKKNTDTHHLLYRKSFDDQINYIIANQCGHILRIFGTSEDRRFIPVANRRTMMSYVMQMEDELHRLASVFGQEKIKQMLFLWYEGVVFQVTKMPPDIMIDKWLYDDYPELRQIQLTSLRRQRQIAILSLSEEMMKITPFRIYRASNIMNYAFFKILGDHFGLDFVTPYHKSIFIMDGSDLARHTERDYVNSLEGDRIMIDEWARRLCLTGWFEWKHIEDL
ncbi:MAG: hypothetical protein ACE14T_03190 [Syntrophales bacterium]